jgi:xanthine dehydrogenase accessory factor
MNDIYQIISKVKTNGQHAVFCIVTSTKGSSPGKPGMKMIVFEDGTIHGSIGGGSLEKQVTEKAIELMNSSTPLTIDFNLKSDLSMECGGSISVYIEPILPDMSLIIFGAGHIGRFLSGIAGEFGFSATVIDEREHIFDNYTQANIRCINKMYSEVIPDIEFNTRTFIVIVTHQHAHDEAILRLLCTKPYAYLGMIGSKTKVATIRKQLIQEAVLSDAEADLIDMPIGIPFNALTHQEIAISILAKLIDVKNSL